MVIQAQGNKLNLCWEEEFIYFKTDKYVAWPWI